MAVTVTQTSKAQAWVDGATMMQGTMFLPVLISMSALPIRMVTLWYSELTSSQIVKQLMANLMRFFSGDQMADLEALAKTVLSRKQICTAIALMILDTVATLTTLILIPMCKTTMAF
ncbi:hypothetical protein TSTA_075100 [Talaromyces stipitatus ATCC 10500]|uniref:Uncharacterized protein n=1 Tax=Talaromyces stipitatus (strain ATCC 10500 / CBS 375.48 / QM 6759 / NRRL 1006) TaxID=441959 RepID=B8LWA6_TALSN|nr:uncharacterized protein TSTA_075100 [Talaromyces stipitatus ATCC 10500]EED24134.1 hypothetical protein TSTA_075100 [Talaromyces stipitatus ATCC 10500]